MRSLLIPALFALLIPFACGGEGGSGFAKPACDDGLDNDGDGAIDFPDDPSCASDDGDTEDGDPSAQCKDGRDNDSDGKIDYPTDPGCFAPNQDSEDDECPDGPSCPQCSDGQDNDKNGSTDYPNDSAGCTAASDSDEYTRNLVACGSNVRIETLPFDGHVRMGMIPAMGASSLVSTPCGGAGLEQVWELRVASPKVIVATTDNPGTTIDTVLYIRGANCASGMSEMTCNDNISTSNNKSSVTQSISQPGTYYLVVDTKSTMVSGTYELTVKFLTGLGEACSGADDCGPSLVCRVPAGSTQKVCAKQVCEDGLDDDGDGKIDFPNDPGCSDPKDETENDSCPGVGPNCPECSDGVDNDGDGPKDFGVGGDTSCPSASSASEACAAADGVQQLTSAMTMQTTVGAINDVKPACASTSATAMAPDRTYRLDVPDMDNLTIDSDTTAFNPVVALYDSTCTGTALDCVNEPERISRNNLAAGTYYYVVDGYSSDSGAFPITISGRIKNGASCESALAKSGAINCNVGYACKGTTGSRTCQPALCSDGLDNDGDNAIDFPFDPGCSSPADDTEPDPATPPVCFDNVDNDMDTTKDYPGDYGCSSAGGDSEVFCMPETDATAKITTSVTTGTTVGLANDLPATKTTLPAVPGTCATSSTAPDKTYALQLPVPVATLNIDTEGSALDTVLVVRDVTCTTALYCDDDGGVGTGDSLVTMTGVAAGTYAITVDGYVAGSNTFNLNVRGTVAPGTACSSPLFSGGTNAVLVCPTGTTCTGTPAKCQ
jgi:hypothetical protein